MPTSKWSAIRESKGAETISENDPNERSVLGSETFYEGTNQHRTVDFHVFTGRRRTLAIDPVDHEGSITVPYLEWYRQQDGRLTLILDDRLMVDLPAMPDRDEDALIEFIANAIAIGAGYASIYYTKRKMPFRG